MSKLTVEPAATLKIVSLLNDMPFKPEKFFSIPAPGAGLSPLLSMVMLR